MDYEKLCMGCMNAMEAAQVKCSYCGYSEGTGQAFPYHLVPGTLLNERYLLGKVLGHGGFGITYIAWDLKMLRKAAIKEYFPQNVAARNAGEMEVTAFSNEEIQEYYSYGLTRFLDEARVLSRLLSHPGIVSFEDFFAANGTAYLVMEYLEGVTFKDYLKQGDRRLGFRHALQIMTPIMDALSEIHRLGLMHRDVSPDNIFITNEGQVKLLDFGAARYSAGNHSRSLSIILKAGYAPEEQYRSRGKQGPWTDIYATAATIYRAVTGIIPPEALDRLDDDILAPPSMLENSVPAAAEQVLLKALAVKSNNRYQTMDEFRYALHRSIRSDAKPGNSIEAEKDHSVKTSLKTQESGRPRTARTDKIGKQSVYKTSKSARILQRFLAGFIIVGILTLPGVYYAQKYLNSPGAAALRSHSMAAEARPISSQPEASAAISETAPVVVEQPGASAPAPVQYYDTPDTAVYEPASNYTPVAETAPANSMPRPDVSNYTGAADYSSQTFQHSLDTGSDNSMPRPNVD